MHGISKLNCSFIITQKLYCCNNVVAWGEHDIYLGCNAIAHIACMHDTV